MSEAALCPACGERFGHVKPVWCADCRAPHHRDCFARAGKCASARCAGRRFSEARLGPGVNALAVRAPDGTAALTSFIVDFTSHRELAANLAIWLAGGVTLAGTLGAPGRMPAHPALAAAGLVLLVAAVAVRRQLSDYRVISSADRQILLHRTFLGRTHLTREAAFSEVARVVLGWSPRGARRTWAVWVELLDGRRLKMTDPAWQHEENPRETPRAPIELADVAAGISDLVGVPTAVEQGWSDR